MNVRLLSLAAILAASAIFVTVYYPVIAVEFGYRVHPPKVSSTRDSTGSARLARASELPPPADSDFGIIVPKIGANSRVIAGVDPFKKNEYQTALKSGVAHSKGTPTPGQMGNMFIFSHSTATLWESRQYNAVFYLLDKLEPGDEIYLFFNKVPYRYLVTGKKIVLPTEVRYLDLPTVGPILTLMTCWPAGTTLKRLLVSAEMVFDTPPIR